MHCLAEVSMMAVTRVLIGVLLLGLLRREDLGVVTLWGVVALWGVPSELVPSLESERYGLGFATVVSTGVPWNERDRADNALQTVVDLDSRVFIFLAPP